MLSSSRGCTGERRQSHEARRARRLCSLASLDSRPVRAAVREGIESLCVLLSLPSRQLAPVLTLEPPSRSHTGAQPLLVMWVTDAQSLTTQHSTPFRPSPHSYASPRPTPRVDRRSARYLRLRDDELDAFAGLYLLWDGRQIGQGEMFARMQARFYTPNEVRLGFLPSSLTLSLSRGPRACAADDRRSAVRRAVRAGLPHDHLSVPRGVRGTEERDQVARETPARGPPARLALAVEIAFAVKVALAVARCARPARAALPLELRRRARIRIGARAASLDASRASCPHCPACAPRVPRRVDLRLPTRRVPPPPRPRGAVRPPARARQRAVPRVRARCRADGAGA